METLVKLYIKGLALFEISKYRKLTASGVIDNVR